MAQIESTSTAPSTVNIASASVAPASRSSPPRARRWLTSAAVILALGLGMTLTYTLPLFGLAEGENLGLGEVGEQLTNTGNGWVVSFGWFSAVLAALSAVVFPRVERFIQAVAISAGAIGAMVIPYYIATHQDLVNPDITSLGSGLTLSWLCFAVAAVIPWVAIFTWDRARPLLGHDWSKWLFMLPAVGWVLLLTVFPLVYAFTTSRYFYRNGRISRFVGWDNYRRLFLDEFPWSALLVAVGVAAIAAVIVLVVGLLSSWLSDQELSSDDLRQVASFIPVIAVPAVLVYLAATILRDPLDNQMTITFIFVAGAVATEMTLGFGIALLLNRELKGRGALRAIMTLPIFATPIALGYLARAIFFEQGGPVNAGLSMIGLGQPPWLSDPEWARVATIVVDVWQWTPFVFIIALAGLQSLPTDVIEAAEVDGANWWQSLRYITMPMMAPILWLIFLLRSIDSFKVLDIPQGLTLGGPGRATEYFSLFNYRTARQFFDYGGAAAQAFLLLFIVIVLVSLLWGRIRHVYEDEGVQA